MKNKTFLSVIAVAGLVALNGTAAISANEEIPEECEIGCYYEIDENGNLVKVCEVAPTGSGPICIGNCWE